MHDVRIDDVARRTLVAIALAVLWGTAAAQPGERGYASMVYVPQVDMVLLFGGQSLVGPPYGVLGDTWWWDPRGGEWREVTTDSAPTPRAAANLAVHAPTGTVVLFGGTMPVGRGFEGVTETWTFDPFVESWARLEPADDVTPDAQIGEMFAYHPPSDEFVLFGGFSPSTFRYQSDTWHLDLAARRWTRAEPATHPSGRNFNAFAYDPVTARLVMSGGIENSFEEVWTYDPRLEAWEAVPREPPIPASGYPQLAWDPDSAQLIRFGGLGPDPATVWSFDASTPAWSELAIEGDALSVSRHAMTAVPGIGLVVFGGQVTGTFAFNGDLWTFEVESGRWSRR